MDKTLELLKKKLPFPDNNNRPVELIHHRYPRTPEDVQAFLEDSKARGLGGFVVNMDYIPTKTETETDEEYLLRRLDCYLGSGTPETDASWEQLKYFIDQAFANGFKIWIYDELTYPSGAAGNKVLKGHPEYQVKGLVCATAEINGGKGEIDGESGRLLDSGAYRVLDNGQLDINQVYPVTEKDGKLCYDLPTDGTYRICGFYGKPVTFLTTNKVLYTDILRTDVVDRFIEVTFEEYRKHLGEDTISKIFAFFTDEPGLPTHGCSAVFDEKYAVAGWTEELETLLPDLPGHYVDIFYDTNRDFAKTRREYWQQVSRLFAENYFGRISAWCEKYGTRFTGHFYGEETLGMQIGLNADLFGLMRYMQIPGVDRIYCTNPQNETAEKTASSAAHLYGNPHTMSEVSFHIDHNYVKYGLGDEAPPLTPDRRQNSAFYQMQLGVTHLASYFNLYVTDEPEVRLQYESETARASIFCCTGTHKADILMLIPMDAAFERYTPQDHKYWPIGPCIVSSLHDPSIQVLEKAYGEVQRLLEDARLDYDLIDAIGLTECNIEQGTISTPYESFCHLVIFDSGHFGTKTKMQIESFLQSGGTVTAVRTDLPTEFCADYAKRYPDQFIFADYDDICKVVQKGGASPVLQIEGCPSVRVRKTETDDASLWFIHNRNDACTVKINKAGTFHLMTTDWKNDGEIIVSDGHFNLELEKFQAVMLVQEK